MNVVGGFIGGGLGEKTFHRTSQQPIHQAFIGSGFHLPQAVVSPVQPLHFERLSRFQTVLLPDFGGQNYLPLR